MLSRSYGWLPPPEAHRGQRSRATVGELLTLPRSVELAHVPAVTDQGPLGSCTGHAVACAVGARLLAQRVGAWLPSPLDLYLGARAREGTVERDSGALLADVLGHAEHEGLAPDALWPHAERGAEFRGPAPSPLASARPRTRLITHEPLDWDVGTLRWELACGYPVVLGLRTFGAFERVGGDGAIPMPEGPAVGGHAMCAVGYDDGRRALRVQNSWGTSWGAEGRAWLPYAYALNPFWCGELHAVRVVRRAEDPTP